jgi:hypothetical protein
VINIPDPQHCLLFNFSHLFSQLEESVEGTGGGGASNDGSYEGGEPLEPEVEMMIEEEEEEEEEEERSSSAGP